MKNKYTTNKTRKTININAFGSKESWDEAKLNDLANQIDEICRRKLPDGVMGGILAGKEAEIRQDTALMLLEGFLFKNLAFMEAARKRDRSDSAHYLERVISIGLRIIKNRWTRKLTTECNRLIEISEHTAGTCVHPVDQDFWDLPQALQMEMRKASLRLGVSSGKISVGTASIVNLVFDKNMSAQEIADSLGITRGAVYQRFGPVRKVLPNLIEQVEVPMS